MDVKKLNTILPLHSPILSSRNSSPQRRENAKGEGSTSKSIRSTSTPKINGRDDQIAIVHLD